MAESIFIKKYESCSPWTCFLLVQESGHLKVWVLNAQNTENWSESIIAETYFSNSDIWLWEYKNWTLMSRKNYKSIVLISKWIKNRIYPIFIVQVIAKVPKCVMSSNLSSSCFFIISSFVLHINFKYTSNHQVSNKYSMCNFIWWLRH